MYMLYVCLCVYCACVLHAIYTRSSTDTSPSFRDHPHPHTRTRADTHQPALALLLYAWSRYQPEFVDTYHVNVTVAALGAVLCSGDEELLAFGVPCQILRRRFVAGVPDQVLSCVLCVCLSLSLSLCVCVCVCVCMYMCIDMYVCI